MKQLVPAETIGLLLAQVWLVRYSHKVSSATMGLLQPKRPAGIFAQNNLYGGSGIADPVPLLLDGANAFLSSMG